MGLRRILDRQRMEIELGLHLVQQHFVRLMQADPDDCLVAAPPVVGFLDFDVTNALTIFVNRRGDNTRPAAGLSGRVGWFCLRKQVLVEIMDARDVGLVYGHGTISHCKSVGNI
jgi:hypothetical protein